MKIRIMISVGVICLGGILGGCGSSGNNAQASGNNAQACADAQSAIETNLPNTGVLVGNDPQAVAGLAQAHAEASGAVATAINKLAADFQGTSGRYYQMDMPALKAACGSNWTGS